MKTTFRNLTPAWPLVIFLLLPSLTRAGTGVQAWVQSYSGPGNNYDYALAVAVDGSNNVIVTGGASGSGGIVVYATIQYSSAGVPLWTNLYNGRGNGWDEAVAVAVDGSNNVIVTGTSAGSGSPYDYATIKYSSAGVPLWTNRYNGPGNDYDNAWALAVDGSNNVIVTGSSAGSGGSREYATIKYSSAGLPLWTNRYGGPGNCGDGAYAVALDSSNNVIVTGSSSGGRCDFDYATIKYSSAGVPLWTNRYNGPGNYDDEAHALALDSSNNVVVTGASWDRGGNGNYTTIKYSGAGVPLWTNCYNWPASDNGEADAVAVDGSNNVIVTGCLSDGGYIKSYATIKYSSAGVPLWTNRCDGAENNTGRPASVAVDHSGNVIVTGQSTGSGGNLDFVTVKYICVSSPVVSGLLLTNGSFHIQVDDVLQPGTLVIEASTNLATTNWSPVFTNTTPTNVLFYTDPDAGNRPARFYRAFQFP